MIGVAKYHSCFVTDSELYFHFVPARSSQHNLFDIYLMLYVQSLTPDDGRKDRPKHVECYLLTYLLTYSMEQSPS
jgi:hypothetical protein